MTNFEADKWYLISTLKHKTVFESFNRVANANKKTGDTMLGIAFACFAGESGGERSIFPVSPEDLVFNSQSSMNSDEEINWRIISVGDSSEPEKVKNTVGIWVLTREVNTIPLPPLPSPPRTLTMSLYSINNPLVVAINATHPNKIRVGLENLMISSTDLNDQVIDYLMSPGGERYVRANQENFTVRLQSKVDGHWAYLHGPGMVRFITNLNDGSVVFPNSAGDNYTFNTRGTMTIEFHFPLTMGGGYGYVMEQWNRILGGEYVSLGIVDPYENINLILTLNSITVDEIANDHPEVVPGTPVWVDDYYDSKVFIPGGRHLTLRPPHPDGKPQPETVIERNADGVYNSSFLLETGNSEHDTMVANWLNLELENYILKDDNGTTVFLNEVRHSSWKHYNVDDQNNEAGEGNARFTRFELLGEDIQQAMRRGPVHIYRADGSELRYTIFSATEENSSHGATGLADTIMVECSAKKL